MIILKTPVLRRDGARSVTPQRIRPDSRRTDYTLVALLVVMALPVLVGTFLLLAKRPDGWVLLCFLGAGAVVGLAVTIAYVLAVPIEDVGPSTRRARSRAESRIPARRRWSRTTSLSLPRRATR